MNRISNRVLDHLSTSIPKATPPNDRKSQKELEDLLFAHKGEIENIIDRLQEGVNLFDGVMSGDETTEDELDEWEWGRPYDIFPEDDFVVFNNHKSKSPYCGRSKHELKFFFAEEKLIRERRRAAKRKKKRKDNR